MLDKQLIRHIVEWDVATWKQALPFWERCAGDLTGAKVLDIGGRHGGLSLYFALRGCRVVCSDLQGPTKDAMALHKRYNASDQVCYREIDATGIDAPDGEFDVVSWARSGGTGTWNGLSRPSGRCSGFCGPEVGSCSPRTCGVLFCTPTCDGRSCSGDQPGGTSPVTSCHSCSPGLPPCRSSAMASGRRWVEASASARYCTPWTWRPGRWCRGAGATWPSVARRNKAAG